LKNTEGSEPGETTSGAARNPEGQTPCRAAIAGATTVSIIANITAIATNTDILLRIALPPCVKERDSSALPRRTTLPP
jgi:hypothetical protein